MLHGIFVMRAVFNHFQDVFHLLLLQSSRPEAELVSAYATWGKEDENVQTDVYTAQDEADRRLFGMQPL